MMLKAEVNRRIRSERLVAILRGHFSADDIDTIGDVLMLHGFGLIEITWNSPNAAGWMQRLLERSNGKLCVGVGTVRSVGQVHEAIVAGAHFLVAPGWDAASFDAAEAADRLLISGVYTATEVQTAAAHGATLVKLFPALENGVLWMRALQGPFDDVGFLPTGGIDAEKVHTYLEAGASAVAVGSAVFRPGVNRDTLLEQVAQIRAAVDRVPPLTRHGDSAV